MGINDPIPNAAYPTAGQGLTLGLDGKVPASVVSGIVPTGAVLPYAAATTPSSDWLICDGSDVSRTTYATLFAVISTTYGVGDGTTTFGLPDLRGRMIAGYASSGHTDVATLGNTDGTALASRRPKHKTSITLGAGANVLTDGGGALENPGGGWGAQTITAGPQTAAPTDTPAYIVLNYLMKT